MPASPFSREANPRDAEDMAWLSDLIATLADHPVRQEHVVAYFGTDAGTDPENAEYHRVSPRSPYFGRVRVALYRTKLPTGRTRTEQMTIAVELRAEPPRSIVEHATGPLYEHAHMPWHWDGKGEFPWFFNSRRLSRDRKGLHSSVSVNAYQNQGYQGILGVTVYVHPHR